MHSSTLFTVATLAATTLAAPAAVPAPATAAPQLFKIKTVPHNAARVEFAQYLSGFHVGAGESTLVGSKNSSESLNFFIDATTGSYLSISEGGRTDIPPATVGLVAQKPYLSDAPAGYDYISANLGNGGTKGWAHLASGDVTYQGDLYGNGPEVQSFALCHVNGTSPYFSVGAQYQLLWKSPETVSSYAKCADVSLKAVAVKA